VRCQNLRNFRIEKIPSSHGNLIIILRGGGTAADDDLELKRSLKMRYFTPREVARLMGFPEAPEFTFPDSCANILCYRLLGNSLNVTVVSTLLEHLFAT